MTDLTWNANHIYNLFKCWRYIPDRNIKKSGHGSNLRREYQRFSDSSWNDNLFHVQSFSSNIFIHNHPYIYTFIHVHPFSVHHFIPADIPSKFLASHIFPWPSCYCPRKPSTWSGNSGTLRGHLDTSTGDTSQVNGCQIEIHDVLTMDTTVRLKNNDAFNNTNLKH